MCVIFYKVSLIRKISANQRFRLFEILILDLNEQRTERTY